ncbi:MAG: molybdenum cofactor biosynthesis protein MoaE [Deltaproteobacteria bacterium]|nr:molybdenum cofactor biosynthesis protein MoaE [Deltaproteobacteria bacterium]
MDLSSMIQEMKQHPLYPEMGMIASHLGVVRATSLNGEPVTAVEVDFDQKEIARIADQTKKMPGIIHVLIETAGPGRLAVGDDIMAVVVAGDTRDHVFPALVDIVNRIKERGARKREIFAI